MMKDCRHPNIVAYFGSYLRRDKLWICMEYCGGGSLQDIVEAGGCRSERALAAMRGRKYEDALCDWGAAVRLIAVTGRGRFVCSGTGFGGGVAPCSTAAVAEARDRARQLPLRRLCPQHPPRR